MYYFDGFHKVPVAAMRSSLSKHQFQVLVAFLGDPNNLVWINIPSHWLVTDATKVAEHDNFRKRHNLFTFST